LCPLQKKTINPDRSVLVQMETVVAAETSRTVAPQQQKPTTKRKRAGNATKLVKVSDLMALHYAPSNWRVSAKTVVSAMSAKQSAGQSTVNLMQLLDRT
jgi:hypothetical protein